MIDMHVDKDEDTRYENNCSLYNNAFYAIATGRANNSTIHGFRKHTVKKHCEINILEFMIFQHNNRNLTSRA